MTEVMTVHEALCELKTMDKRIHKAITECKFAVTNRHFNQKIDGVPIKEFCEKQASNYQSVMDLIKRRNAIKRAVVASNASAVVKVAGNEYTVAQAIDMKNNGIGYIMMVQETMMRQLKQAQMTIERSNGDELQSRADTHIRNTYGNQQDMKSVTEDIRRDRETFIENQTVDLVQPAGINLLEEIERMDKESHDFLVKVDAALSVSNATTNIEIDY